MNLGKGLLGAVIGGAAGLAAHVGIESTIGEAAWFPVVTGVLTGFCVRKFDPSVKQQANYVRGAAAGLIALAAIFGSSQLSSTARIAKVNQGDLDKPIAPDTAAADQPAEEENEAPEADGAAGAGEPDQEMESAPVDAAAAAAAKQRPKPSAGASGFDFAVMGIGCFLAYELARGNTPKRDPEEGGDDQSGEGADATPPAEPA
ncbi:MAG: hypothetical protein AAF790_04415 [Planctomycetota bacterium]